MRRDVISAYAASGAKILSWVVVSGFVYRFVDVAAFAMLALIRGTIGILNYTTLGLVAGHDPYAGRDAAERGAE